MKVNQLESEEKSKQYSKLCRIIQYLSAFRRVLLPAFRMNYASLLALVELSCYPTELCLLFEGSLRFLQTLRLITKI